jgi:L-threonylcarbamoyladenylate synthase
MPHTRLVPVNATAPEPKAVRQAADVLLGGGLVAFPTETVYGLGALVRDPAAVAKVYTAKGRPGNNPLIVHVKDVVEAKTLTASWPDAADRLAAAFWPGPLTLVLPKAADVPNVVTAGGPTVALRQPAHPVAAAVIAAAGPVAAPSANRSGELSPTTADHVLRGLSGAVDLILDGGPCPGGLESTVVDLTGPVARLLRPGLITADQLKAVLGELELTAPVNPDAPLPSPGLLTRHYAPRTALECAATPEEAKFLATLYETAGLKVARYAPPADPPAAAAALYADLHNLDAGGFDRIIVALPPDTDAWQAVRDRLTRAAAEG